MNKYILGMIGYINEINYTTVSVVKPIIFFLTFIKITAA